MELTWVAQKRKTAFTCHFIGLLCRLIASSTVVRAIYVKSEPE